MSNIIPEIPYSSSEQKELQANRPTEPSLILNAWSVQGIVFELITNFMARVPADSIGYSFSAKYDRDPTKSGIFVDIAYNWNAQATGKRPAIFIQRGDESFKSPTMGQTVSHRGIKDSEIQRLTICSVPIIVRVIASPIGFCEQLAEYIKGPLLQYRHEIQNDFKLRQFKVEGMSAPKVYTEVKDNFVVDLEIATMFDDGWIIKGDDLKLKTVGRLIFDGITTKPLIGQ